MRAAGRTLTLAEIALSAEDDDQQVVVISRSGRVHRLTAAELDQMGRLALLVERDDFDADDLGPEAA